jgi:hypothetical protein
MAIFKRIYPKTNTEGSVGRIMDIPGSTSITYSGGGINTTNADLKIPHIGGVSEYFLKGIQTALRPKGFGDVITFADNLIQNNATTSGLINCDQTVPEISVPGLDKQEADALTKRWLWVVGHPYWVECNNDVIKRSQARRIDPIFVLAIWIHESDASNYSAYSYPIEDFGIHGESDAPSLNFSRQLDSFLNKPDYYYAVCGKKELRTFVSMFWLGHCEPRNATEESMVTSFIQGMSLIYAVIAPGIALPNYPN